MESTLPTLDMLRLTFMKQNSGYSFGLTETGIECPLERDGLCNVNGARYWKWIAYIIEHSSIVAKNVNMKVPNIVEESKNPYRRLIIAQENYNILRQHPVFSTLIQKWRLNPSRVYR